MCSKTGGHPGHRTIELATSHKRINRKNWFFCKFKKDKNYFNNSWVAALENGHETLISEWMDESSWFLVC